MDEPAERSSGASLLVVADRALRAVEMARVGELTAEKRVLLLDLSPDERVTSGSLETRRLRIDELLDLDRYHRDVVEFLDCWPRETLVAGRPFREVFRHTTGDSLWWTGPGSLRHPFSGPLLPPLRAIWIARAAIEREQPSAVMVCVSDRRVATLLRELARGMGVPRDREAPAEAKRGGRMSARGSARASPCHVWTWFAGGVLSLIALAVWIAVRAVYARLVTQPRPRRHAGPTIVMSGWYPNHVRDGADGRPQVVYWQRLADALRQRRPDVDVQYLLHTTTFRFVGWRRLLRPFSPGWGRLRWLAGLLPLSQCHPRLGTYVAAAVHQLRLMQTYARFERGGGLQTAPRFAGINVSSLLVPHLRKAVASTARWSRNVAAVADSLRSAGDVRGVLVHEEFYPKGMLTIAAARSLGIPTIGVQHGQVGPQHAVYMPPPGHIADGPCPDWFAAYGDSVRRTLSEIGAYPSVRIRVVGAPRFDELATQSPDRAACRLQLGWKADEPVVLLTTETFALSAPIVRALVPLAREQPGWRFVIKLHPHEREPQRYAQLILDARADNIELVADRLAERLAACDVLVTGYSTTAMEGLLIGRPVICADFTTWPDRYPYVPEGAALPARTAAELRTAIAGSIEAPIPLPKRKAFLKEHLGPTLEGRAAETFVQTISELQLVGR